MASRYFKNTLNLQLPFLFSFFVFVCCCCSIVVVKAQTVTNVSHTQEGNKFKVVYDIENSEEVEDITINVFYSYDGGDTFSKCSNTITSMSENGSYLSVWDALSDIDDPQGLSFSFKVVVIGNGEENKPRPLSPKEKRLVGKWKLSYYADNRERSVEKEAEFQELLLGVEINLEIFDNGTFTRLMIEPAFRNPQNNVGEWNIENDEKTLSMKVEGAPLSKLSIVQLEDNEIVLRVEDDDLITTLTFIRDY